MAKRLRKEEQIMPDIRILTEGDSSVLVEFGKEISPEINRKITATVQLMKEQRWKLQQVKDAEKFMRFLYAMEENMVRILRILQNMPDFP